MRVFLILCQKYKNHLKIIHFPWNILGFNSLQTEYTQGGFLMELLQLQYFKTIAECQHITKAANKLMISQPSLSNTLSRIENELGVQLFDRQGRNIVLNNYGRIVLEHTNNILRELDNIHTEIDEMEQRQNKVINIASPDSLYLREWLPKFINQNRDLSIRHSVPTMEKIELGLLNGSVDFGIFSQTPQNPAFDSYILWEDDYVVLTPLGLPSVPESPCDFAEFEKIPFVAFPSSEHMPRSIDILSKATNTKPNIVFEGDRGLLERVQIPSNAAVIISKSSVQSEADKQLCAGYCNITELTNPEAHLQVTLSWDQRRTLSAAAQVFLDYVKNNTITPWHITSSNDVYRLESIKEMMK